MSWLVALEKVYQRAAARASQRTFPSSYSPAVASRLAPAASRSYDGRLQPVGGVGNPAERRKEGDETEMKMSSSTTALHRVSDTWSGALEVIQFSQLHVSTSLERRLYELPLSLAAESVAILLEAGKGIAAVDLLHSWSHPIGGIRMRSKVCATRHLQRALRTLGAIGDVDTLRSVISILHRELLEQKRQRQQQDSISSSNISSSSSSSTTSTVAVGSSNAPTLETLADRQGLLSALGPQRTRVLLVKAVHELVLQNESLVPVYEKLTWINAVAVATTSAEAQMSCLIPFELQEDFHRVVERSPLYNARLLLQVGPAFACGFRQPTQCSPAEILSTPRSEIKRMYARKLLAPSSNEWRKLQRLLVPHSPCIRDACEMTFLLHLLCSRHVRKANINVLMNKEEEEKQQQIRRWRQFFVTQLQSPRSSSRRMWSRMLLRHTPLLCHLRLSPLMVFSTCSLTFRSFHVHWSFVRCCLPLLRRLRRISRDADAARVVWNHLSVVHYTLAALFTRHPRALEDAVAVVCRIMREGVGGRSDAWMGHRSLALLRAASAATTPTRETGRVSWGVITPAHCIPICAAALDCGVHFATVQQFIMEMFPDDNRTAMWVLNMVRLRATSHVSRVFIPLESSSHGAHLRSLLRQYAYECSTVGSPAMVEVRLPSRSKLLALWSMLNDDGMSIPLRRLICRIFLDEVNQERTTQMNGNSSPVQQALHSLFREEVLTSIASNCTTESSFIICMDALIAQRRMRGAQHRVQLLQLSEMDNNSNVDSGVVSSGVSG